MHIPLLLTCKNPQKRIVSFTDPVFISLKEESYSQDAQTFYSGLKEKVVHKTDQEFPQRTSVKRFLFYFIFAKKCIKFISWIYCVNISIFNMQFKSSSLCIASITFEQITTLSCCITFINPPPSLSYMT